MSDPSPITPAGDPRILTPDRITSERQRARQAGHNVTFGEMWEYTERKVDEVSQFYMTQVPEMLKVVVGEALIAYDEARRVAFSAAIEEFRGDLRMTAGKDEVLAFLDKTCGVRK